MDNIVEFDILKTKVLKYILYKKRTEKEVRKKFQQSDDALLEDVINYLKEAGYINDEEYIQRAVNEFINLKTLSIREISYKLYSKGLKNELIEEYMENQREALDIYEKDNAKKIFYKKRQMMSNEDIIIFLRKKGYKEESIKFGLKEE